MNRIKTNKFSYITILCFLLIISSFILNGCFFIPQGSIHVTSEPSGAKIYLNGEYVDKRTPSLISHLYPGSYLIKVTLEEESIADEESINVLQNRVTPVHFKLIPEIKYRALCVGINDYKNDGITNLRAPSFDVARLKEVFENSRFGDGQHIFSSIDTLISNQATRDNILQSIASSFSEADDNDVSYFYFSGHGWGGNGNISTILPYDAVADDAYNDISADELASALSMISGIKVVILDSCFSGGFIGKSSYAFTRGIGKSDINQFNNNIIKSFELFDMQLSKDNLAKNSFKVITSATGNQECYETLYHPVDGNPFGYFSASLCEGCGYNNFTLPFPADYNNNRKITLNEIYQYIKNSLTSLIQDTQVYPSESSFVFVGY